MGHYYWNDWYMGWGWFLWLGVIFLLFSNIGTWGYNYRVHRRYFDNSKDAIDILNERYAKGEIKRDEFHQMKKEILESKFPINEKKLKA